MTVSPDICEIVLKEKSHQRLFLLQSTYQVQRQVYCIVVFNYTLC